MTPTEHAQLLRELADELYSFVRNKPADSPTNKRQIDMVQRARQAAEEIEGRRRPTDMEIIEFWSSHCAGDGDPGIIKLARFGGGEVK